MSATGSTGAKDDGTPTQRFLKDMIQVGEYRHPIDGYRFSVTQEKLTKLASSFNAMKANGVAVEVVKDHSLKAEDVVGYLESVFVEGDRLIGVHEMVGKDSIALANTVRNVSLMIEPNFVDGKGNKYGEAIVHSAIVQRPVVPGQKPFVIQASAASSSVEVIALSIIPFEDSAMKDFLEKLAGLLGIPVPTEADALAKVTDRVNAMKATETSLTAKLSAIPAKAPEIDPDVLDQTGELVGEALESLVTKGNINRDTATKLSAILVGTAGKRDPIMLSARAGNRDRAIARQVIDALKDNKPVALAGEQSGNQTIVLSAADKAAADKADADYLAERRARVQSHVN